VSHTCNGCGKDMRYCDQHGCVRVAAPKATGGKLSAERLADLLECLAALDIEFVDELRGHIAAIEARNRKLVELGKALLDGLEMLDPKLYRAMVIVDIFRAAIEENDNGS